MEVQGLVDGLLMVSGGWWVPLMVVTVSAMLCRCSKHVHQKVCTLHTGSWLGCVGCDGAGRDDKTSGLQGGTKCVLASAQSREGQSDQG